MTTNKLISNAAVKIVGRDVWNAADVYVISSWSDAEKADVALMCRLRGLAAQFHMEADLN